MNGNADKTMQSLEEYIIKAFPHTYYSCEICVENDDEAPAHPLGDMVHLNDGRFVCDACLSDLPYTDKHGWEPLKSIADIVRAYAVKCSSSIFCRTSWLLK